MKDTGLVAIFRILCVVFCFFGGMLLLQLPQSVRAAENSNVWMDFSVDLNLQDPDTLNLPFPIPPDEDQASSPLYMSTPGNITTEVEYNPKTKLYTIYYKVGNVNIRAPKVMNAEEYSSFQFEQSMREYWQQRSGGGKIDRGSGILPKLEVGGESFDRIFGSNVIEIIPEGNAELLFGITSSKTDNPTISEDLRRNTTFDFQSKIQMNVNGTVGEKLRLEINYNTEATFDFENNVTVDYTGFEDEIIQDIEAGNVSLPLPGSLITGSHSLFGLKTQLKFGKLYVTSIFSQQNSETQVMEVKGGAQTKEFDIQADEYEENKHFFLSHYFRDTYNRSLENLPIINSGINITRVEVWVTNKRGAFDDSRDIVAFHDIGENQNNIYASHLFNQVEGGNNPRNTINNLYELMTNDYSGIRNIAEVKQILDQLPDFVGGTDYEKIENDEGRRLIFFGRFAGLAGAINSLWSLGQRLKIQGIENPFQDLKQTHHYPSLEEAKKAVAAAGKKIAEHGLPSVLQPLVIGFTGYGNVSRGAQEIINLLPSIEITPEQLLHDDFKQAPANLIYKVVFRSKDLSKPKDLSLIHISEPTRPY